MKTRRIIGFVLTLVLIFSAVALAVTAAPEVNTSLSGSLTLTYTNDGQNFAKQKVQIYRVAEISKYAEFQLTGAFSELPVEVNQVRTQDEWKQIASTLSAYITAQGISADKQSVTDENGSVSFGELPLGLYLVSAVRIEQEKGYYLFDSFMISLPNLNEEDDWVYDVNAKPKSSFCEYEYEDITYQVSKLWKDEGNSHKRPQTVSVELYQNGSLVETVTLSAENNWTYSWTTKDDGSIWQAVEAKVPNGYTVTLEQKELHFVVTNSYDAPEPPPQTGDTSNINIYLWIMCGAGLGLIILGVTGKRKAKV